MESVGFGAGGPKKVVEERKGKSLRRGRKRGYVRVERVGRGVERDLGRCGWVKKGGWKREDRRWGAREGRKEKVALENESFDIVELRRKLTDAS